MSDLTCFSCRDGNTPLYCLNCADDILKTELTTLRSQVEKLTGELVEEKSRAEHFKKTREEFQTALGKCRSERDQAVAACAVMREALSEWKLYYESQLVDCENQIAEFTKSKDTHGVNLHQGRKSGIIQHDIGLQKFKDALASTTCGSSLLLYIKELETTNKTLHGLMVSGEERGVAKVKEENDSLLERLKEARELLGENLKFGDGSMNKGWMDRRDTWLKGTP